jgi:NAD+ kinase
VTLAVAEDSAPIAVDVDGTPSGALDRGDRLTMALRRDAAEVVRLSASDHASRSRIKLSLLDLPLRPGQLLDLIPPELRQRAQKML